MSIQERLISGFGGGLSIFVVFALTRWAEQELHTQAVLIASMGASAVLLFAAPHAPLSQPWNVIGGHVISALIGVLCYRLFGPTVLAAGIAAGLAITAMLFARCLHPPGGASSVIPILAAGATDDYGLMLVLFPIGAGAVLMVLIAVFYNLPFPWRRYPPALWARFRPVRPEPLHDTYPAISHEDFVTALAEIDTYVDISEEDLLRIYHTAMRRSDRKRSGAGG